MSLAVCRFPRGRVQSKCIHLLIFKGGHINCAWDSYFHQAIDKHELSIAPPPFYKLDKTGHHLSHGGDADRPCQKQVRTPGRKRAPPKASHHPPPTRQTACLQEDRSDAPGASCKSRSGLEASPFHHPGRRPSCTGIARNSGCIGRTSPERLLPNRRSPQTSWR